MPQAYGRGDARGAAMVRQVRAWGRTALAAGLVMASATMAGAQVRVDGGLVEGSTNAQTRVRAFKGIPYAAPPVGELRWQAPHPVVPWDGVKKATAFGARCMQA